MGPSCADPFGESIELDLLNRHHPHVDDASSGLQTLNQETRIAFADAGLAHSAALRQSAVLQKNIRETEDLQTAVALHEFALFLKNAHSQGQSTPRPKKDPETKRATHNCVSNERTQIPSVSESRDINVTQWTCNGDELKWAAGAWRRDSSRKAGLAVASGFTKAVASDFTMESAKAESEGVHQARAESEGVRQAAQEAKRSQSPWERSAAIARPMPPSMPTADAAIKQAQSIARGVRSLKVAEAQDISMPPKYAPRPPQCLRSTDPPHDPPRMAAALPRPPTHPQHHYVGPEACGTSRIEALQGIRHRKPRQPHQTLSSDTSPREDIYSCRAPVSEEYYLQKRAGQSSPQVASESNQFQKVEVETQSPVQDDMAKNDVAAEQVCEDTQQWILRLDPKPIIIGVDSEPLKDEQSRAHSSSESVHVRLDGTQRLKESPPVPCWLSAVALPEADSESGLSIAVHWGVASGCKADEAISHLSASRVELQVFHLHRSGLEQLLKHQGTETKLDFIKSGNAAVLGTFSPGPNLVFGDAESAQGSQQVTVSNLLLQKMLPAHVGCARSPAPIAISCLPLGRAVAVRMRINNGVRPSHSPPGRGRQARGRWGQWSLSMVIVGFPAQGSTNDVSWMEDLKVVLQSPEPEMSSTSRSRIAAWALPA
eukprot:gnl/MRDRNA2_/MRDRNA2_45658_c0_seq1.p1 gnl/MRDRNA2_/MRDRNA2_45658_c0~~gnl/MRDRNA2_/MRDRNA2_45658_c0_seq1.p1  ORF type:complete len:657 (+),score=120.25 gnl/MRDRNA2_/MRDRNA2_45658_c0_seq1:96-2066(+)